MKLRSVTGKQARGLDRMKTKSVAGIVDAQVMTMSEKKDGVQEVEVKNDRFKEAVTKGAPIGKKEDSW